MNKLQIVSDLRNSNYGLLATYKIVTIPLTQALCSPVVLYKLHLVLGLCVFLGLAKIRST